MRPSPSRSQCWNAARINVPCATRSGSVSKPSTAANSSSSMCPSLFESMAANSFSTDFTRSRAALSPSNCPICTLMSPRGNRSRCASCASRMSRKLCCVTGTRSASAIALRTPRAKLCTFLSAGGCITGRYVTVHLLNTWHISRSAVIAGDTASTHDASRCDWRRSRATGCTAISGANAPSLNWITHVLFVHVASGKMSSGGKPPPYSSTTSGGLSMPKRTRRLISSPALCARLPSSRLTPIICVARAIDPMIGILNSSDLPTPIGASRYANRKASKNDTWFEASTGARNPF
mmetsp:Transcript_39635/g.122550  ORF Transcript_39635/g.122550 Transcript_39635/m.122550 type:complete len:292 (+) Transcript_39635:989-1864(+)